MARITVEDCLTRENNRFALVQLASKRTKQLLTGATPQTSERKNKAVVTALREIADGVVRFMSPEEAKLFEEQKAQELEAQRIAGEAEKEKSPLAHVGIGLFGNGGENKTSAFLRDALMSTGPVSAGDDDDDEE